MNQRKKPEGGELLFLGNFLFEAGRNSYIEITNAATDGHVIVDAIQLVPTE